jgi:XTP/dITP diphosphohydrolase
VAADDVHDPWDVDDVAAAIVEKLVRRHPHVFGDVDAADASAVQANWETIKAAEKQRSSVLDGIPVALPALARAAKVLGRLERMQSLQPPPGADRSERIGDDLLAVVRRARTDGVDAEQALRQRLSALEAAARAAETSRQRRLARVRPRGRAAPGHRSARR